MLHAVAKGHVFPVQTPAIRQRSFIIWRSVNKERIKVEPGIYFNMPEAEYFAAEGLSASGMKHLAVSPLNYWHRHLNADYQPPESTVEQRFGKAAHCMALEPERFDAAFATKLEPEEGVLVTMDDLKTFCEQNGLKKTAKKKQELIDRIMDSGLPARIWDFELANYMEENAGKTFLTEDETKRVRGAAATILNDRAACQVLRGVPEVSFFARDPRTGVMLKARMDLMAPDSTKDLKTFSNSRNKPVQKVVFDTIYYESYYLQCVHYQRVRELVRAALNKGEAIVSGPVAPEWLELFKVTEPDSFDFVFIESCEPHHVMVVQLVASEFEHGEKNVYWLDAENQIERMTRLYADCIRQFGDRPWRELTEPHLLQDTDMPQLMFHTGGV